MLAGRSTVTLAGIFLIDLLLFFGIPWPMPLQASHASQRANFAKTAATPDEEVRKMLADLELIAGPTMDVPSALKQLTKTSMPYLQAIHPVSSLAAAGMKTLFKPSSDEFSAMVYLNLKITERFAGMDMNIEKLRTSISYDSSLAEYGDVVTLRLSIIEPIFSRIIDPEKNPPIWRGDFVRACRSNSSPLKTLHWMNLRINEYCSMPTKVEAKIYADINDLFFAIENRLEVDDAHFRPIFYEQYRQRMIGTLTGMPMEDANEIMARLHEVMLEPNVSYAGFDELWDRIKKNGLHNLNASPKKCLLKEVIEANQFKRHALLNTLEIVRRDVARLETIAGICANVSTDGSEEKMLHIFNEINSLVVGMTIKMDKWTAQKLESAWPDVILSHAKERYRKILHLSKYQFNQTAHEVMLSANKRGPQGRLHSVLITRNWNTQEWFWSPCLPSYGCTKEMDFRGTNLVITRHPMMAFDRTVKAHNWLERVRGKITAVIEKNWKTDLLPWLLNEINLAIGGGIADPTLFANVVFVHNSKLEAAKCTISYGIAGTWVHLTNLTSFQRIDYFSNSFDPSEPNAENFKLFLFL